MCAFKKKEEKSVTSAHAVMDKQAILTKNTCVHIHIVCIKVLQCTFKRKKEKDKQIFKIKSMKQDWKFGVRATLTHKGRNI